MSSPDLPASDQAASEPVLGRAAATLVTTLVVDLLVYFAIPVTPQVQTIILGAVTLAGPAVLAALARMVAWSPASVASLVEQLASQNAGSNPDVNERLFGPGDNAAAPSPKPRAPRKKKTPTTNPDS